MNRPKLTKALLAATAALALTGCAGGIGGSRSASASDAAAARADGKIDKAIALAEQAALAAPQDPVAKAELGSSYLAAGRFASAQQAFDDALVLGDVSPHTALGFVLSSIALGENRVALGTLDEWRDAMSAADLGLAYALAGNPELGAQVLTNALRSGENTPVVRQNLAYTHALAGQWATARIIAAEDVDPAELDARISYWAGMASPEDYTTRVAALLGVEPQADDGMPAQLALNGATDVDALLAAADGARKAAPAPKGGELPPVDLLAASTGARKLQPLDEPVGARATTSAPKSDFASAFVANNGAVAARAVSTPVVQSAPSKPAAASAPATKPAAAKPVPARETRTAASALASGSHLVQLGSYGSEADAKRGWAIFAKRFPQISDREQVITRAKVRGRIYYRLSAGNLAASSARSLCKTVKASGQGCIAWEESKPLPGSLDTGRRVASR
ncbi:SPOR domain-containing protein [Alteriqipengyuania sp. 357]